MWKCSHNPFTGTITAKICRDKEVGKARRCFDVSIDISEVAVLAVEMSKEEETWRRGTMGMTPHPTATNNIVTRLAARRLRRRAGPPSYRVILRSGICCQLSLIAVNHIVQPAPEKLLSFDTPFQGK